MLILRHDSYFCFHNFLGYEVIHEFKADTFNLILNL